MYRVKRLCSLVFPTHFRTLYEWIWILYMRAYGIWILKLNRCRLWILDPPDPPLPVNIDAWL